MKKIILVMLLLISSAFAELVTKYPTQEIIDSKIKIIDIRIPQEWKEDGMLKGAIPITFFNEKGQYDVPAFLAELGKHVKAGEQFALICHTGSRTKIIADFFANKLNLRVIDLKGGMVKAKSNGLKIYPYMGN